jgi:hypothetical protein
MRALHSPVGCLVCLSVCLTASGAPQSEGVSPQWDARTMLSVLTAEVKKLEPLLAQLEPRDWVSKGAPEAYIEQFQALRTEIGYFERTVAELALKPNRASKALEVYFRLQAIGSMTGSVIEAVRRYQNPAVADLIQGALNESAPYDRHLRDYLIDLVATQETECRIADEEAQRCRQEVIRRPAPSSAAKPRSQ